MIKYKPNSTANQIEASVLICYGEFDKEKGPKRQSLSKAFLKRR